MVLLLKQNSNLEINVKQKVAENGATLITEQLTQFTAELSCNWLKEEQFRVNSLGLYLLFDFFFVPLT